MAEPSESPVPRGDGADEAVLTPDRRTVLDRYAAPYQRGPSRLAVPELEEAARLQASIAQVRRTLDDVDRTLGHAAGSPVVAGPPPRGGHRRRRFGPGAIAALVVVVLLVVGGTLWAVSGSGGTSTPSAAANSQPPPVRPSLAWPGSTNGLPADLSTAGPGVSSPGDDVIVAPGEGSSLEVFERVRLPAPGESGTRLVLPRQAKPAVGSRTWVRDLEVFVDGQRARAILEQGGWTVRSTVPGSKYRSMVVRYRLVGGVVRGRQLAGSSQAVLAVAPLWAIRADQLGLPVLARADGRVTVKGVSCPGGTAVTRSCGQTRDGTAVAALPSGHRLALVLFRADLLP